MRKTIGKALFLGAMLGVALSGLKRERARVLVVNTRGEVLLVKCLFGRQEWELPGGGAKANESLRGAAARELREEVGIVADEHALVDLGGFKTLHRLAPLRMRVFALDYADLPPVTVRSLEIAELQWWPADNLPHDTYNNYSEVVEKWRKRTY